MKFEISKRDRRMLLVLAVFFAALGYYYLALAPLWAMSNRTEAQLSEGKANALLTQAKVQQFRSWQSYSKRLGERIARIYAMIEMPASNLPAPERMDAIMRAAAKAGVEVDSLKPMPSIQSSGAEMKKAVTDRFTVEGHCSFMGFMKFLRGVYGMKINQFALSEDSGSQGGLSFYLVLESLPKEPRLQLAVKPLDEGFDYEIQHDLFQAKHDPIPKALALAGMDLQQQEGLLLAARLRSVKLDGTAWLDGANIAIISDPESKDSPFSWLHAGDKLRGASVMEIKPDSVLLSDGKSSCVLRFSSDSPALPAIAPQPQPQSPPQTRSKAKLGLDVQAITPDFAQRQGLQESSGLLVLKSRPGIDIQPNDVIVEIGGVKTLSTDDALRALQKFYAGDMIAITFIRNGQELKTQVKVD